MSYDDIEIEDMEWSESLQAFTYPCPCGDLFQITRVRRGTYEVCLNSWQQESVLFSNTARGLQEELLDGEEIARCPSCSLYITVICDPDDLPDPHPPKAMEPQPPSVAVA